MRDDARFPRTYSGDGAEHAYELDVEDMSTRELMRELVEHAKLLAREEAELAREGVSEGRVRLAGDVALAKHEIGEEVGKAKRAGTSVGVGAVLCHAALYFLLGALALALFAAGLPLWVSTLLVGALALGVGYGVLKGGAKRLGTVHLVPKRTIERFKEDRRWMTERFRALTSRIRASA